MICVSLWQPWASLIALGAKRFETRSWPTSHRGPIAIHAAKNNTQSSMFYRRPFFDVFKAAGIDSFHKLPLGCIVATARLVRCVRTEEIRATLSGEEIAFGDFTIGRFAWELADVRPLPTPVPYRGAQGLFQVSEKMLGLEACKA